MKSIPLDNLHPHPGNPRLSPREDVVEQIAAQINGHLDEAHALIVRPKDGGYEIISGHTRKLAAERAGLEEVPCWIRKMSDEEAYMALVLNNAQGELHPLEIGLHALNSGIEVKAYAEATGVARTTLQDRVSAARVMSVTDIRHEHAFKNWQHLAAIHAAPKWLWRALVKALIENEWTVDATRKRVKPLDKAVAPPDWVDWDAVASEVIDGVLKASDLTKFQASVDDVKQQLSGGEVAGSDLIAALDEALEKAKPYRLSRVIELCGKVLDRYEQRVREAREKAAQELAETEAARQRVSRLRKSVSLTEWSSLDNQTKSALLNLSGSEGSVPDFNKQTSKDIEWAQWSWNPITGCLHDCPYCYARDIANQTRMESAYPNGFAPTLRPLTLLAPKGMKVPADAKKDARYRNVFTGSMADIFGRWVPAEWIEAVLNQVRSAPQWNFLFLTKFPNRMAEFDLPGNAWVGTSVDLQVRVAAAEKAFAKVKAPVKWLSVEPMLEPIKFSRLDLFDWIVIGGASRSTKTPEWQPPEGWVHDLVAQARTAGVKVYEKTNCHGGARVIELPAGMPTPTPELLPDVFRYLTKKHNQNTAPEAS